MGNKQKSEDTNKSTNNVITNTCFYIMCPNCWQKIPDLTIFIESSLPKVKINCFCLKDKKKYLIMNLRDYLTQIKTHNYLNNCSCNNKNPAKNFCMNCETFFCDICFDNHNSNFKLCEDKLNEKNLAITNCKTHISEPKKYFCKECQILFCKLCFLEHNIKIKKKHKGVNILTYLNKAKIKTKTEKYEKYQKETTRSNTKVINKIYVDDTPYLQKYKEKICHLYKNNSEVNDIIKKFVELLLQNCDYFDEGKILNKNFICNVIKNTCFNLNNLKSILNNGDNQENTNSKIECVMNYFQTNFINCKLNSTICKNFHRKINRNPTLEDVNYIKRNSNSNITDYLIEQLCLLKNNKFASVDHDCTIRIYNTSCEILYTLIEHTNNVTSIILLNSTENNFATCSDDNTIKIWDYEKGKCIKTIVTEGSPFMIYEKFNQKNQIGCLPFRNSLNIYDINGNDAKIIFNKSLEKKIPWIEGLYQFPNNGNIILSTTVFFEVFTENIEEIKKIYINKETPKIFLYLENGDLAVGLLGVEIFIYNQNLQFKKRLVGHCSAITSLKLINNKYLLSSSLDSKIILWNIEDYELKQSLVNNDSSINDMIVIDDQKQIITGTGNKEKTLKDWIIEIFLTNDVYEEKN